MKPIAALPRTLLITAVSFVGFAACSSNDNKAAPQDISTIDATLPSGLTLPPGVGLPTSGDCLTVYMKFVTAMTSAYMPNTPVDFGSAFDDVAALIPDDLQDDLAVMSNAYEAYGQILAANNNDASNPAVQEAIQALATDEVNTAGNNLQDYFETTCPGAG